LLHRKLRLLQYTKSLTFSCPTSGSRFRIQSLEQFHFLSMTSKLTIRIWMAKNISHGFHYSKVRDWWNVSGTRWRWGWRSRRETFNDLQTAAFWRGKKTLRSFAVVAILVLITNIAWLVDAKTRYGIQDGYGTIRKGECSQVKSLNAWLHLAINLLSTLLLTGSNAFMAAFSCPSRKKVDKAHQRRRFLRVGSFSLWNLRSIAKRKGAAVLLLVLSSAPFHLLWDPQTRWWISWLIVQV